MIVGFCWMIYCLGLRWWQVFCRVLQRVTTSYDLKIKQALHTREYTEQIDVCFSDA